jgi:hypothetical protein
MANLDAIDRIRVIEKNTVDELTLPAAEAILVGSAARIGTSDGKAYIGNASAATEAVIRGIVIDEDAFAVNRAAHILRKGIIAAYDSAGANILDGMSYDDIVYLSATDSLWADADPGENETVTLTFGGTPTGGTFTLTFGGEETGNIAYNASAATVQAALEALSTIGSGNVLVTGTTLPDQVLTVEFVQDLGHLDVGAITYDLALLTGGSPTCVVAVTNVGVQTVKLGRVVPLWDQSTPTWCLHLDVSQ